MVNSGRDWPTELTVLAASASGRRRNLGALEHELALGRVDPDGVAGHEAPLEDRQRQLVDQALLDHPLERPGAVRRVVAQVAEQRPRRVGQLDLDVALADPLDQALDLQVDDLADLLAGQRLELDDVVEAVDELGPEVGLERRPVRPGCSRS